MENLEIQVIVVPENNEFKHETSHELVVYTNKILGEPQILKRNAKYLVPFWLDKQHADRIFHINPFKVNNHPTCYSIDLGNSFKLKTKWDRMSSHLRFEYWPLEEFGLKELTEGILVPIDFDAEKLKDRYTDK